MMIIISLISVLLFKNKFTKCFIDINRKYNAVTENKHGINTLQSRTGMKSIFKKAEQSGKKE